MICFTSVFFYIFFLLDSFVFIYTGIVQVRINKWVLLSFCLPHKAHQIHNRGLIIEPETIDKCLQKLRPYHGILLLVSTEKSAMDNVFFFSSH